MHTLSTKLEIFPPDISAYKVGNTNVDYVHYFDSGKAGPNVTISAIVHGNELCGAIALDYILQADIRPQTGSLTLCFCNVEAYLGFNERYPYASRYIDEDFNRLWNYEALGSDRQSLELTRARKILPFIEQTDILLDLHSMSNECAPLALSGIATKGIEFANELKIPRHIVIDEGHSAGARMRDFPPFIAAESPKKSLLLECGQHWQKSSSEVAYKLPCT